MAANPPPSSPSFISKLPVELLKRIVEEVHEQDKVFQTLNLTRATPDGPAQEQERGSRPKARKVDVPGGVWPALYGRGIGALSRVNKTMRSVALPFLFETVHARQLNKPFFRLGVVGEPTSKLVQHLDLNHGLGQGVASLFDIAWTFSHLPSVRTVTLRASMADTLARPSASSAAPDWDEGQFAEREIAGRHYLRLLARITHLQLLRADDDEVFAVLQNPTTTPNLQSLRLISAFIDWSPARSSHALDAVQSRQLQELIIDSDSEHTDLTDFEGSLPSLSSLDLPVAPEGTNTLSCIEHLAPNLTSLRLSNIDDFIDLPISLSFPHLTHLSLSGPLFIMRLVPLFLASPLRTLILVITQRLNGTFSSAIPFAVGWYPPSLKLLQVESSDEVHPPDFDSFSAKLAAEGVIFSARWTPGTIDLTPAHQEVGVAEQQRRAIKDDLSWAAGEADRLGEAGDEQGMQELASSLLRLRQKRMLALQ